MTAASSGGHFGSQAPAAELNPTDALEAIRTASSLAGYGIYLGAGKIGPVWAPPERSVLVLGPPRSGKTTALVIPSVLAAPGAVVSTSTKPDVLAATAPARIKKGPCLVYDPSGTVEVPAGVERARWSPVTKCIRWDDAMLVSHSLVSAQRPAGHGARPDAADHWTERAQSLLAPLLHAAALEGVEMAGVLRWVDRREPSHAMAILDRAGSETPADQLAGIAVTEAREQSGIWSTASSVLSAYRSSSALATTVAPDFDARSFCDSNSTLYVCATGSRQELAAPLVVGLLSEIREAAYSRAAQRSALDATHIQSASEKPPPLVLALDEVANIAPLPDLPSIISEGGGQGVVTLACLQDLSQARARWGQKADGFLSLFGTTVVLPGIGDVKTLETLSVLAGDHEVQTRSISARSCSGERACHGFRQASRSRTGDAAGGPHTHAHHIVGPASATTSRCRCTRRTRYCARGGRTKPGELGASHPLLRQPTVVLGDRPDRARRRARTRPQAFVQGGCDPRSFWRVQPTRNGPPPRARLLSLVKPSRRPLT